MGHLANRIKTFFIFLLLILLLVALFQPDMAQEITGKVTALLG